MSSLVFIGQQIYIYLGIPTFIIGTIGGFLNIIVFLSLKTFRENSCAFYLIIMSFMNVGQLIAGLFSRIMISGFNIDWTQTSIVYCKLRPFIINTTALISASCLCLATIDQYFATCIRPRWQQWSNIKLAHRLIIIFCMICFITQIPCLIFNNHVIMPFTNQTSCLITNVNFSQYNSYFTTLTLWYIMATSIAIIFGILGYQNIKQIPYRTIPLVRRELDKQLTIMVFVQVLFNFIAAIPNIIIFFLRNNNNNLETNVTFRIQISFTSTITICLFYIYFSCPFYIYICVSERFRRQLIYVIFNIHLNRIQQQIAIRNQIAPIT